MAARVAAQVVLERSRLLRSAHLLPERELGRVGLGDCFLALALELLAPLLLCLREALALRLDLALQPLGVALARLILARFLQLGEPLSFGFLRLAHARRLL